MTNHIFNQNHCVSVSDFPPLDTLLFSMVALPLLTKIRQPLQQFLYHLGTSLTFLFLL